MKDETCERRTQIGMNTKKTQNKEEREQRVQNSEEKAKMKDVEEEEKSKPLINP